MAKKKGSRRKGARRAFSKAKGVFRSQSKGGSITHKTWEGFKEGTAYSIVAGKFAPQFAPIAQLYGEYRGGGFEGLLINEIIVQPLLGRPSALGSLGINLNLGGILGGGQQAPASAPSGAV